VGLAFAVSDVYLGTKSFLSRIGSIIVSVTFSAVVVWLMPFQWPTAEILGRTQPNLLDLGVAVFSGLAGSLAIARSLIGGAASALAGVAIAVVLMPPLCTADFEIGIGWNGQILVGASRLFITNLVAISGSAFLVFYLEGAFLSRNCIRQLVPAYTPPLTVPRPVSFLVMSANSGGEF